ncbi:MAG: tRNA 2-selenouridine(34) synthase MnmH [Gammaproteobacteria bacterium]|nr:tRNA 2-selenouridine(34) synthase MnmH [Gammaproteobacteria bacterium]
MSEELPQVEDFRRLVIEGVPLLDVRAPVEFYQGAFPHAENHCLINDAEREQIGRQYKHLGQNAAIDLGHELVTGKKKDERIAAWRAFAESHPDGVLYCFRGGMRSKIAQRWLYEASGIRYPRIRGGYKALRRFLIDELEVSAREVHPIVIGGRTGVGKTLLLHKLSPMVDLEGLAWHRGSAFGNHATPQPRQISFENALSIELIKLRAAGNPPFVVEDEHRNVGSCFMPDAIRDKFRDSPLVLLEASLEERVENTHQEYIHEALAEHAALYGEAEGFNQWADYLLASLDKIKKRLGAARHAQLRAVMQGAIAQQRDHGEFDAHRDWIRELLGNYYDPMYDYQIQSNEKQIAFKGERAAVIDYLAQQGIRYQP